MTPIEPFELHTAMENSSMLLLQSWYENNGLTAGFSTRHGLNTALHVGDIHEEVLNNRRRLVEELGFGYEAFTCAEQVHGKHIHVVTREDRGRGRFDRISAIPDTDALITNEPDLLLAMYFADCVPLYFFDPVTRSMGLAHAGWKGSVAEIAISTIQKLSEVYGAKPDNIIAAIGPSIGSCCYEVDESVLVHVRPLLENASMGNNINTRQIIINRPENSSRAHLDLKHLNQHLMIKAGILPSNIEISSWCTSCHNDLLFSHRKEKGATGRMMSWIGVKGKDVSNI